MEGMADPVTMAAARAAGGTTAATAAMIVRGFGMPVTPSDQVSWMLFRAGGRPARLAVAQP
jgi:hypothetical protein